MKTCTSDQVHGVITSGMASPRFPFDDRKSPSRLSFHTSSSRLTTVIGRACTTAKWPSCRAHSMSTGPP